MKIQNYVPIFRPFFILTVFLATPRLALGSFEEFPTGARAAGMGNAFAAIADDVYSCYYNPAGLVQLMRPEFSAYYAKLYAGLDDGSSIGRSFLAYGHPLHEKGTLGISYLSLSLSGLYSENTIGLSYAHAAGDRWNIGGTVKFLRKSFGSDTYTDNAINVDTGSPLGGPDPLFSGNGKSKATASLDIGAQYRLNRVYGLGFVIANVNSPNIALSDSDSDRVAPIYKVGMARRTQRSAITAELSVRKFTQEEFRINTGAERRFPSGLALRGGLGFGQRQYQITSFGFGYEWENVQADYAFIYPLTGVKGTFGTHQISLTFRLGKREP